VPALVKGVLTAEGAVLAVEHGASAVGLHLVGCRTPAELTRAHVTRP
jgi:hypothetical protein